MTTESEEKRIRLIPCTVREMRVVRTGEPGAFLDAGTGSSEDDVLLHNNQQTRNVSVGETLPVFLYLDPHRRIAASMRVPKMKEGQIARMRIINVVKDGAFADVGAERGIFMPYAGMRGRPQVGDVVWAKLYTDKSGRLCVTMEVEDEIRRAARPAKNVRVGDMLTGEIYNVTEKGAFLFSRERYIVFIDRREMKAPPKIGGTVSARVTYLRVDGRVNGSLREIKEKAIESDSELILSMLRENGGRLLYGDASPAGEIREKLGISKAAFKRALGHLIKEGLVRTGGVYTCLVNRENKNG